ncbi:MAG: PDZ domain-containing protein, partial [candidate division WOR-3 bacterium]
PLPVIPFADPDKVKVGDWVIAVGNPFGLQGTVTVGVISAKGRSGIPLPEGPSRQDFIQTDAAINPGNSGGALVNTAGELVGINTAIRSPVGANVGIGFAVPADLVRSVTDQLIEHGRVVRGYLGIRPQEVTDAIRKAMKLGDAAGVLVSEVLPGTPAAVAGMKVGDVIVEVNGVRVSGVERFRRDIAELRPGTRVKLTVFRNGRKLQLEAKLTEFTEERQASVPQDEPKTAWLGLSVRALTTEERQRLSESGGVAVEEVERGRPAAEAGIQRGDVILRVGDSDIANEADFAKAAKELAGTKEPILLYLKRDGRPLFVAVEPD